MNDAGRTVHRIEIFIEEDASGSVRPVDVVADAPIYALVPALVEELELPQVDLSGKKLTYALRYSAGGKIIPASATLLTAGIAPGERLVLEAFAPQEASWQPSYNNQPFAEPVGNSSLHSSNTLTDFNMQPPARETPIPLPAQKPRGSWTRRAFLVAGAAVIGVAGTGIGYAAYHNYFSKASVRQATAQPTKIQATPKPSPMSTKPTMAKQQMVFAHHQQIVRAIAWSPDGTLLASGADDAHMFVWDSHGAVRMNIIHPGSVRGVAWSPDGKRLATGAGTQLAFFNVQSGIELARSIHQHTQMIMDVAWATHGLMQVVSVGQDERAIVWNTNTYAPQTFYRLHTAPIQAVSWSADGTIVATASQGGYVRIWSAANGVDVHSHYQDTTVPVRALAFSPEGMRLAAGADDGTVRLWNAQACQNQQGQGNASVCIDVPQRLHVSATAIRTVAWSHDGRFLAAGTNDGVLSLWDPAQPQQPLLKVQQQATVHSIAWSPDDKSLALATGNAASLWSLVY